MKLKFRVTLFIIIGILLGALALVRSSKTIDDRSLELDDLDDDEEVRNIISSTKHKDLSCVQLMPVSIALLPFDVYVINMKHENARLHGFKSMYNNTDLAEHVQFIRFEAVIGKDINPIEYCSTKAIEEILRSERLGYRQRHYELTRGGIGCWLSHVTLWKQILQTDKDVALIFEDDALCSPQILSILQTTKLPIDWDLFLLGHVCVQCKYDDCNQNLLNVERFFGLHGYMINRTAITKILRSPRMRLIEKQIDSSLSDMIKDGELTVYGLAQQIAWQDNVKYGSSIQVAMKKIDPTVDEWE
jgi:GR25 family glycosyltransferase involved in LPS biosynthesis